MKPIQKVLVIKLGGVGDVVLAFPAFERIRAAHPKARITLLTTEPFEALAAASRLFNAIETDGAPKEPGAWAALIMRIRRAHYDRVYDLQNDSTTNLIFQGLRPLPPPWSGTAMGCSLPHKNAHRDQMHPLERHAEQLRDAGIWPDAPTQPLSALPPDISWILAGAGSRSVTLTPTGNRPLALLAPGGVGQGSDQRWPPDCYAELAKRLQDAGFDIAIVGALGESGLAHVIQRKAQRARDLTGRGDLVQIAGLGARAALAVGNDIGALHLMAAAGAPTIALIASGSAAAHTAPRGHVTLLHAPALKQVPVEAVARAANNLAAAAA
jgi:ADP-heptose:LPS heptosyltransferase